MKIPGFTAEMSLYKTGESYFMNEMFAALKNDREILQQAVHCFYFRGRRICIDEPILVDPWWRWRPDPPDPWSEGMSGIVTLPI